MRGWCGRVNLYGRGTIEGEGDMAAKKQSSKTLDNEAQTVLQLRVELLGSEPSIWRRVQVPADMDFFSFHLLLQQTMGWENCHMYAFRSGRLRIEDADAATGWGLGKSKSLDSTKTMLAKFLAAEGDEIVYEYDFGDSWEHLVKVEKVLSHDEALKPLPICLDGAMNCPPEDCGGIDGFYTLLAVVTNPKHKEYRDMKEWLGAFDPKFFSAKRVNTLLQRSLAGAA